MKFFTSRYLLFVVLALIVVELVFRTGLYEAVVSPPSHAGTTITLKHALEAYGKEQVNVVTLGDSRAGQGLDHGRIYESGKEIGVNHLKLTLPGTHLMTLKALSSWSFDELENLEGVVIALSPAAFVAMGNGAYELGKVMPLRNDIATREMFKHVPFSRSDIRTFAPLFSVAAYREDIKDLLANPVGRIRAIERSSTRQALNILTFTGKEQANICAVPVAEPDECLRVLKEGNLAVSDRTRTGLERLCKDGLRTNRRKRPGQVDTTLVNEWVSFLEGLAQRVQVMLVILPEHSAYREYRYHPRTMPMNNAIVGALRNNGKVEVVDLHRLLMNQEDPECGFFLDGTHVNLAGKQLLTDALMPELEAYWASLPGSREAKVY